MRPEYPFIFLAGAFSVAGFCYWLWRAAGEPPAAP